jgi:hypothetical protein
MTDASEFAHVWADMTGGGWRPQRIKAHPQAQDPQNPLVAVDPMTGQTTPTADYILRYITDGNQFTENAAEAARQWMPQLKRDILGPQHVRTVPASADVATASGVVLLCVGTIGDLKARVPELSTWTEEELKALTEWKPRRAKVLIPESMKGLWKEQQGEKGTSTITDATIVFWMHKYCQHSTTYPDGADLIVTGAQQGMVLKKGTLRKDLPQDDKDTVVLLRDIPVSQCRALLDSENRDPFGRCPIDLFGQTGEGLAQLFGAVYEDTDKRLHPNIFTPGGSPVQDWQMNQRSGKSIPVNSKDDLPMYEDFADLPSFLPAILQMLREDMDDAAGLGSAAQMLNTPQAISGVAKNIELNQTKVALTAVAQNFFSFTRRYWRIKLQTAQAFLTQPQQIEYSGVDEAYKQRWWTGADFAGVKDVAIQAGTGTLMSPAEKQQFVALAQSQQWLDPDEAAEAGRSTVAGDLGVRNSLHEDTIKRELAKWNEGPPEPERDQATGQPAQSWDEQAQAYQAEQQQLQMQAQQDAQRAQQTGQPPQPAAQPTLPAPWSPFMPRPTDQDQSVARRQYKILRDFLAGTDYSKHEGAWRGLVDQRYLQAMAAAGIQTVQQQQEAAAQQAAQQAQGKQADQQAKSQGQQQAQQSHAAEKDKDRQFKASEGQANRAVKSAPPQRSLA